MSILKRQVISYSSFVSFFIVMTHNFSVNFKLIPYLLWTKESHQSPNFKSSMCSGENLPNFSCHFSNGESVFLQNLHNVSVSWKITPFYLCGSNNVDLAQKEPINVKIFETFQCSGQNLSNSSCQFWKNKSIPLQILYPSSVPWKITSLYFFSSNNIYYAQKEHIKMKLFQTFKHLGQNLSNSSCQFWNHKLIPLRILHHSSLSWHITPLSILSSYFFYFGLKDPIKVPILRLSSALVKICHIPHVIFQTTSQFFFKFCITLQCYER